MSRNSPVMGSRGHGYQNCRRVTINMQVQQLCTEEEAVGFVDLWGCFVGKANMFMSGITDQ